jgi:hypothetical protein
MMVFIDPNELLWFMGVCIILALLAFVCLIYALRHLAAAESLYDAAKSAQRNSTSELERIRHIMRKRLSVRFGPIKFRTKGESVMLKGPSNVDWCAEVEFFDDQGVSAPVDGLPTFDSTNPAICTIDRVEEIPVDDDHPVRSRFNVFLIPHTHGTCRINGLADKLIGEGKERLEFFEEIEVLHPKANSAKFGALTFIPRTPPVVGETAAQAPAAETPAPVSETPAEPATAAQEPENTETDGEGEVDGAVTREAALEQA